VGYPLVSVSTRGRKVTLRQRRFFSDPEARENGAPTRWLVPVVLRIGDGSATRERRELLRSPEQEIDLGMEPSWVLGNAGARGFYRVAYEPEDLRRLIAAVPQLATEERMTLVADQWALVRAGAPVGPFIELCEGIARTERDHVVLDEVVSRLSWLEHRGVSDADRPLFHEWMRRLFAPLATELGWDTKDAEDDERRLLRAAALRALALVARDAATVREAQERYRSYAGAHPRPLDPNLLDLVVAAAARTADRARFEELRKRAGDELDPAAKRRFLLALAMVEQPDLISQAVELSLQDDVKMQDFASYAGTLLAGRATREAAWQLIQNRWGDVKKKADSPMLLRRLVESLGALPERQHLEQIERFLIAHPIEGARQAIAQTLERLRMDVVLRERLVRETGAWLRAHPAPSKR
jgi:puromycin-sensitive aminopeptidase